MCLLMGGDSPKITPGVHEDLSVLVCAHVGVCIYAKLSRRSKFEHARKMDEYVDQAESPCLNERVNSL